jgi:hemerythrin superfamily protein
MHIDSHQNPRIVLEEDHRHIETLLARLIVQVRADDRAGALSAWKRVESVTLAHLDAEEMFLFPTLTEDDPSEAKSLLGEHAEIRRTLGELGLAFELHTVRCEAVEAFCSLLRDHASREEAVLYPLAERRLQVSTARTLFERLRGAAAVVVRRASPRPRRRTTPRLAT